MADTTNGKHFGGASEPNQPTNRGGHFAAQQQAPAQPGAAGRHAATGSPKPPSTAAHVTAPNRARIAQSVPSVEGQANAAAPRQAQAAGSAQRGAAQVQPSVPVMRPGAGSHAAVPQAGSGAGNGQTVRIQSPVPTLPRASAGAGAHAAGAAQAQGARHSAPVGMAPATDARHGRHAGAAAADNGRRAKGGRADKPGKPKRNGRILSTILIVVGVALLLVAGGLFIHAQLDYAATDANNEKLAAYATISDDAATDDGCPITVDWESLKAVNDDVVGWVYIPGTNVNFPVYQGETNETYLRTSATGEYSVGGQIFMDYENARPGLVDRQTILYGHHLNNGAMFAQIDEFANQNGLESLQTIWYLTETATYELEPLCFYKTPATNAEARTVTWASDEDFHSFLSGIVGQATAKSDAAVAKIDSISKVLSLCTCDYENDFGKSNGRGLLVCALKSEIEGTADTSADTSSADDATAADQADATADGTDDTQSI